MGCSLCSWLQDLEVERAGSNFLLVQKAAIAATQHRSPLLVDFKAAMHQARAALLSAALHAAVVWTSLGHGCCAMLQHSGLLAAV